MLSKPYVHVFFEKQGLFYILRAWVRFFRVHLPQKMAFCLLAPPKLVLFLIISNENIFFKIQGTILGAIVAPNKGLE